MCWVSLSLMERPSLSLGGTHDACYVPQVATVQKWRWLQAHRPSPGPPFAPLGTKVPLSQGTSHGPTQAVSTIYQPRRLLLG